MIGERAQRRQQCKQYENDQCSSGTILRLRWEWNSLLCTDLGFFHGNDLLMISIHINIKKPDW
jgi:hypothetical protein